MYCKLRKLFVLYFLIFIACSSSTVATRQTNVITPVQSDVVDLKLKLKKGETYYIANESETEMSMDMMGMKMNINGHNIMGYEYFVENIDQNGNIDVRVTIKDIKVEVKTSGLPGTPAPSQQIDYDSKKQTNPDNRMTKVMSALLSKNFKVTFDPQGNTIDLQGLEDIFSQSISVSVGADPDAINGLAYPNEVKISPDGDFVYVASLRDDAIAVFRRDKNNGLLSFEGAYFNGEEGTVGVRGIMGANSIEITSDGKYLYTTCPVGDEIQVFERNISSGALTYVETIRNGEKGVNNIEFPVGITLSPDENYIYVANRDSDNLMVFSRNSDTGMLTFIEVHEDDKNGVDGLFGASSVIVSPDGKHVYVTGQIDDAVAVFSRNNSTGQLSFVEYQMNKENVEDGLDGAFAITLSHDGSHVYVGSGANDAITVFSRNSETGALTLTEVYKNGIEGVDGIDGPLHLEISPDDSYLYVTGSNSDAVTVFSRNSETGALTWIEMQKNLENGVRGLDEARGVEISSDGAYVYVTGRRDDAVNVFERDSDTGMLTFLESHKDGVGPIIKPELPEGLSVETIQESIKDMLYIYPDNPVRIGDSWTKKRTVPQQGMILELNSTYTLQSRSNGLSTVEVKGTTEMKMGSGMPGLGDLPPGMSVKFNMQGTQEGTLFISETTGLIQESDITLKISGNMEMTNPTNPAQSIDIPITMTIKTSSTSEKK